MKNHKVIGVVGAILVVVMLALFGRRDTGTIGEQVVVTAIGLEAGEESYHLSIQAVDALKTAGSLSEQTENATTVYQARGMSVAQALQAFLNETGRSTYILHNRIIALNLRDYRDHSLFHMLDYFMRNPDGRTPAYLVLCRDDPAALLDISSANDAIPAEYVAQLLEEGEEWGIAWPSRLLDAERAFGGVMDLVMPIVGVEEETPQLEGTAVFRGGQVVGELDLPQTTGLLFAADRINKCLYTVEGLTFRITEAHTDLTIIKDGDGFSYTFTIGGNADIVEAEGNAAVSQKEKERLTEMVEQVIVDDLREALHLTVVQWRSDPLGLARQTAKQYSITQEQAASLLTGSSYACSVDIRLVESGFLT